MNNLCKALMIAAGGAIAYITATKLAKKITKRSDTNHVEENILDETTEEDVETTSNIFNEIRKGIKDYMMASAECVKAKIGFCREVLNTAHYRMILGIIVFTTGVGIGSGLIASAHVQLPE